MFTNLLANSWWILIWFLVPEVTSSPPEWPLGPCFVFLRDLVLVFLKGSFLAAQLC